MDEADTTTALADGEKWVLDHVGTVPTEATEDGVIVIHVVFDELGGCRFSLFSRRCLGFLVGGRISVGCIGILGVCVLVLVFAVLA